MRRVSSTSTFFLTGFSTVVVFSMTLAESNTAERVTVEMETQTLNLDSGAVSDRTIGVPAESSGGDVLFAYNADRKPHAVIFPAEQGVKFAFINNVSFEDVSAMDVRTLKFSDSPPDVPLEGRDTVVVVTDTGAFYKLGNAVESETSVSVDYELIQ